MSPCSASASVSLRRTSPSAWRYAFASLAIQVAVSSTIVCSAEPVFAMTLYVASPAECWRAQTLQVSTSKSPQLASMPDACVCQSRWARRCPCTCRRTRTSACRPTRPRPSSWSARAQASRPSGPSCRCGRGKEQLEADAASELHRQESCTRRTCSSVTKRNCHQARTGQNLAEAVNTNADIATAGGPHATAIATPIAIAKWAAWVSPVEHETMPPVATHDRRGCWALLMHGRRFLAHWQTEPCCTATATSANRAAAAWLTAASKVWARLCCTSAAGDGTRCTCRWFHCLRKT